MQHLPKQALFLGRALKECLDCSLQPLPDELNILLEMLDGAERRRRIQATLNTRPNGETRSSCQRTLDTGR